MTFSIANHFRQAITLSGIIITLGLILAVPLSFAAPTKLVSYQGRITDANGQPITDGSYSIRFKMYTTSADCTGDTASNLVWGPETQATVQATNGLFSVILGSVTAFTQDFNSDYYLQIKVGANPVFSPCDRLTAAPYAIRALDANAASSATNASACNADATCETQAISATGDITLATTVQIDYFDETGDKVYWYSNTYGTGIESSTLTDWSASQFRWRIGGTSVSTGTEKMLLTTSGLTLADDLTVNGYDINLVRGDFGYIHRVGRISFDWTAGTYDGPDFHGLTSKAESNNAVAGAWADDLSINSYSNVIITLDSNQNSVSTFKIQNEAMAVGGGTDRLTLDESGNLTVTGTISGGAINASDCSFDTVCTVQQINSGQGDTEVYLMNQNIRTTDAVTFGELTTGDINVPNSITFGNNRADDGTYEWVGWNSGASRAGIFLWDGIWNSCDAGKFCVMGDTHQLNLESVGANPVLISDNLTVTGTITGTFSGTATNANACNADATCETQAISATGTITTPGYVSITGVSDSSGNLRFSAANPYISASSYFIAPGGAYFNSGTVYTEATIQARGGVADDGAGAKLDLNDADGVNVGGPLDVTGGAIKVDGNTVIDDSAGWHRSYNSTGWYNQTYGGGWYMSDITWIRSYGSKQVYIDSLLRADGGFYKWDGAAQQPIVKYITYGSGTTMCPTSWKVFSCDGGDTYESSTYTVGHAVAGEGAQPTNFEAPNNCPTSGRILCAYAP